MIITDIILGFKIIKNITMGAIDTIKNLTKTITKIV